MDKQFKKKLEKEFDYISDKVLEMRAEAEHMASDARERFNREIDGLAARADRLRSEFTGEGDGVMSDLSDKFRSGVDDIKRSLKSMRERFK
jgi:hypothetical protein